MNRRALFSFLGTAPLGAAVALTLTEPPKRPVLVANEHKCACGSPHFHYVPRVSRRLIRDASGRYAVATDTNYYAGFDTKCLWCNAPWTGPGL